MTCPGPTVGIEPEQEGQTFLGHLLLLGIILSTPNVGCDNDCPHLADEEAEAPGGEPRSAPHYHSACWTLCPEAPLSPLLIVIQLLVIFWYQLILILQLVYGDVVLLLIYLMCKSIRTLAWPSPWKVIKSTISGVTCYLIREWQSRRLM